MNASDFNARMAALPEPPTGFRPPYWEAWRRDVWERGQVDDPANFMNWPAIYHCMLVNHWSMDWQYSQLAAAGLHWLNACLATKHSPAKELQPGTLYSKNLINLAYHFLMWEQRAGRKVADLESIIEWGGGYGGQALVAQRLGFTGLYTIYDLPEFSLLQEWFLSQVGVSAKLRTQLPTRRQRHADLLIGIYSLSEMPLADRARVLDRLTADSYLLAYSPTWEDYDNEGWFYDWTCRKPGYTWLEWPMSLENGRPDLYCVGWR